MKRTLALLICLFTLTCPGWAQAGWTDPKTGLSMTASAPWRVKPATSSNAAALCYLQNTRSFSENGEITTFSGSSAQKRARSDYEETLKATRAQDPATTTKVLAEGAAKKGYFLVYSLGGKHTTVVATYYLPLPKQAGQLGRSAARAIVAPAEVEAKGKELLQLVQGLSTH